MGFSLIKHLKAVQANVKLFYIDSVADLPRITDKQTIQPGSEAWEITSGISWVLNSQYEWVIFVKPGQGGGDGPSGIPDVPAAPVGAKYLREATGTANGRWILSAPDDTIVENFTPNKIYLKYTVIVNDNKLYRALADFTAGTAFVETDWEQFSSDTASAIITDFVPATAYSQSEVIQYKDRIYRAKVDFTSGAAFTPTDWEEVSKSIGGMTLAEWAATPLADRADYTVITDSIFDA